MRPHELFQYPATPLTAQPYPFRSTRFKDREYLNVVYRTEPAALAAVVPEPLEVTEPLVRFEVMKMGEVDGFGPYTECGQTIPVVLDGEPGEYLHAMYLDSFGAAVSGRELAAYPKAMGAPALFHDQGALVGTLDFGTQRVATATMAYKWHPLDEREAREQITVPQFALKIVRGYSGEPRVCELARTEITDITVKEAWSGPARLQLFAHVLAPLADLPVLEIVSASHVVTDLTLAPMKSVHDYLRRS
jgi:acetoacetate decarboxylase